MLQASFSFQSLQHSFLSTNLFPFYLDFLAAQLGLASPNLALHAGLKLYFDLQPRSQDFSPQHLSPAHAVLVLQVTNAEVRRSG